MRHLAAGALVLLLAAPAWGATYYVDGGCTNNGDGNGPDCAAALNGTGPFNVLDDGANGLVKTLLPGDTLDVRGAHAIGTDHTSSANHKGGAAFDGWYFQRWLKINFDCAGAGCTIKAHNWTAAGTGEVVIISGTRCPHPAGCSNCDATTCTGSWTQCANCASGTCNGVPGTCTDTWFTTDDGTAGAGFQAASASSVVFAQSASGAPVYMVAAKANLATTHTFATNRCSTSTWKPCATDADCYPTSRHGTCSATATEVQGWNCAAGSDANSCPTLNTLFVHWQGTPPARPYVAYNFINTAFDYGQAAKATAITVDGFVLLNYTGSIVPLEHGSNGTGNITINDQAVFYCMNGLGGNGDCRAVAIDSATPVTFNDCEWAYTADEGMHVIGKTGAATAIVVNRGWIHNQGDGTVFGVLSNGTPSGILLGDNTSGSGNSDFTGTEIKNSLFTGPTNVLASTPLRIETANNFLFHDNIVTNQTNNNSVCVTMGHASQTATAKTTNSNQIYNNLFNGCVTGGIDFDSPNTAPSTATSSNSIYNNTFVNIGTGQCGGVLCSTTSTGAIASNLIRNNILYSSGTAKQVNWAKVDTSNLFEFNLVSTGAATAATWNGGHVSGGPDYSCAQLTTIAASDLANCPSPAFVSASDFHIQTTSPAKDAGTATGMPAGRTTDICNSIASLHGLPSYNDCQGIQGGTWDMGIDEFLAQGNTDSGCTDRIIRGNSKRICSH
jgi:hypothetical protein